jgi:hypothetical protein
MSRAQAVLPDPVEHRRRTTRQVRHAARVHLHTAQWDDEALDDALLPVGFHDLGRKSSPPPRRSPSPGRRAGFKVWKTPFWKRRRQLWAVRNAAERDLSAAE